MRGQAAELEQLYFGITGPVSLLSVRRKCYSMIGFMAKGRRSMLGKLPRSTAMRSLPAFTRAAQRAGRIQTEKYQLLLRPVRRLARWIRQRCGRREPIGFRLSVALAQLPEPSYGVDGALGPSRAVYWCAFVWLHLVAVEFERSKKR